MNDRITINGNTFEIPVRFGPGHVCSIGDAQVLQAKFAERIRKRFADKIGATCTASGHVGWQNRIWQMAEEFVFDFDNPVEAEAFVMAQQVVKQAIRRDKGFLKDYTQASINEAARKVLQSEAGEAIRKMAADKVAGIEAAAKAHRLEKAN